MVIRLLIMTIMALFSASCADQSSAPFNSSQQLSAKKYLYVLSGACYGGGVTTATGPSNTLVRFDLTTGNLDKVILDYNQIAPGDSPVSFSDFDSNRLLVLVENTAGRRIDIVNRDGSGYATYLTNATALSAVMRAISILPDFSVLVSKSSAIEKFNAGKSRVTSGANPFVNAPAAPCATATTLISSVTTHSSSGKIVFTHAAATPNNKVSVISSTGYVAAGNCLASIAAPATTALPTRAIFHSSGKLLVSYGSTTTASNYIYSYDFNSSTGALTNATAVYDDGGLVINGPSSMAEDAATGDVYVANVTAAYNTIEKFHYSGGTEMTRDVGPAFIPYSVYTRCVADMKVAE